MFHGQPKVEYAACTILNRWVTMTISNSSKHVVRALAGTLLAFSTAALLGACVVAAPPQRVYVEPPPPAPRGPVPKEATPKQPIARKLKTKNGRALYRPRTAIVEPARPPVAS